ncbi:MAG TPA: hypothetical protein VKR22_05215 [Acidimicrobiales bacterium]|nr:hypothetical protein [Acidimicrobiales bacterium]
METKPRKLRRAVTTGALVVGAAVGAAGIASAATSSSSSTTTTAPASGPSGSSSTTNPPPGPPPGGANADPATVAHGPGETLLTGTDLQKATDAANSAEPGATIIRAETDSSGQATYEVHMKKADGTDVTVQLDANFNVTGTVSGFGPGPAGSTPPPGAAPGSSSSSGSTSSSSTSTTSA